jgi:ankyrin repeat protein
MEDRMPEYNAGGVIDAAMNGDCEALTKLISQGNDINAKGAYGESALHWAALKGREDMVTLLLTNNVDTTVLDTQGDTAEKVALKYGYPSLASAIRLASERTSSPQRPSHVEREQGKRTEAPQRSTDQRTL